jgi:hypothetical protein
MPEFARDNWRQCQKLTQDECGLLMKSNWEHRGKALSQTPH